MGKLRSFRGNAWNTAIAFPGLNPGFAVLGPFSEGDFVDQVLVQLSVPAATTLYIGAGWTTSAGMVGAQAYAARSLIQRSALVDFVVPGAQLLSTRMHFAGAGSDVLTIGVGVAVRQGPQFIVVVVMEPDETDAWNCLATALVTPTERFEGPFE